jgi:hypothetical protein
VDRPKEGNPLLRQVDSVSILHQLRPKNAFILTKMNEKIREKFLARMQDQLSASRRHWLGDAWAVAFFEKQFQALGNEAARVLGKPTSPEWWNKEDVPDIGLRPDQAGELNATFLKSEEFTLLFRCSGSYSAGDWEHSS